MISNNFADQIVEGLQPSLLPLLIMLVPDKQKG